MLHHVHAKQIFFTELKFSPPAKQNLYHILPPAIDPDQSRPPNPIIVR